MIDVFLSYASGDRPKAQIVRDRLAAKEFKVFWDQELSPGFQWSTDIAPRLREARAVVVLWSRSSIGSNHVQHEAELARTQSKLIPVLLDDLTPEQLPMGQAVFNAASLADWPGAGEHPEMTRLERAVAERVAPIWFRELPSETRLLFGRGANAKSEAPAKHDLRGRPGPVRGFASWVGSGLALAAAIAIGHLGPKAYETWQRAGVPAIDPIDVLNAREDELIRKLRRKEDEQRDATLELEKVQERARAAETQLAEQTGKLEAKAAKLAAALAATEASKQASAAANAESIFVGSMPKLVYSGNTPGSSNWSDKFKDWQKSYDSPSDKSVAPLFTAGHGTESDEQKLAADWWAYKNKFAPNGSASNPKGTVVWDATTGQPVVPRAFASFGLAMSYDGAAGGHRDPELAATFFLAALADGEPMSTQMIWLRGAGLSEDTRRRVQELLAREGHYTGRIDGVLGPTILTAVTSMQAAKSRQKWPLGKLRGLPSYDELSKDYSPRVDPKH